MRIGTRGSALARAQTDIVRGLLHERFPDLEVELKIVKTTGDKVTDRPLSALGGFGAFVKELDQKIVDGEIDVAVNSLKDMPVDLTPGTTLAAVLPRGPVEDVLLSRAPLERLPEGAVIGSSSVRRGSQLLRKRPDLVLKDLRGNVPTRIKKWKDEEYDAIIIAKAGMYRLGIKEQGFVLDPNDFVPAVGQGAIAIVCLKGGKYEGTLAQLEDPVTRTEVDAERYILRSLGGGCSVPIGAWAKLEGDRLRMRAVVVSQDPSRTVDVDVTIPVNDLQKGLDRTVEQLSKGMDGENCGCQ